VAVVPVGSAPFVRTPTTLGHGRNIGWPSIAASASIPPTPQPRMPRPLIMVVCESVPRSVSGKATPSRTCNHAAEVLQVDLVADAHAGGDDTEVAEGTLRPPKEGVALGVASVLPVDVQPVGAG